MSCNSVRLTAETRNM